jgi:hypothetical protein
MYILWPLGNVVVIWYILWPLGNVVVIWYSLWPLGNVVVIWYIFPRFGKLCQEKSGSPAPTRRFHFLKSGLS